MIRWAAQLALVCIASAAPGGCAADRSKPLPSWRDGGAGEATLNAVWRSIDPQPHAGTYVAPHRRIAVFDHDGMLIVEQPIYLQYAFVIDRVAARFNDHPEWAGDDLLRAAIARDHETVLSTRAALARLTTAAGLDGLTVEEHSREVQEWIETAQHPTLGRPWRECVYQPMLELLRYLESHGYECFIVTGAGADFVRALSMTLYGLPPQRVIGHPDPVEAQMRDGAPVMVRLPLDQAAPYPGKPSLIHGHIGQRPVIALGAGDGDIAMLEYTEAERSHALVAILHHTDAEREFAYDRESRIGRSDRALDVAAERGWLIIDMKRDWKTMFPAP